MITDELVPARKRTREERALDLNWDKDKDKDKEKEKDVEKANAVVKKPKRGAR